jgi:hypothetical protein
MSGEKQKMTEVSFTEDGLHYYINGNPCTEIEAKQEVVNNLVREMYNKLIVGDSNAQ